MSSIEKTIKCTNNYLHMNWEEIKSDSQKVYPASSITLFMMDTESGKPATHWVDKAYKNYAFKEECMFNCYVSIDLTDEFNVQKKDLDFADIEEYFTTKLREVGICHIVARITTDIGLNLELYVDNVENSIDKFNEIEDDPNRLVNFNCEIRDDADWENVEGLLN